MVTRPDGPKGRLDNRPESAAPGAGASPAAQWEDWVTIWQSELNALATDKEIHDQAQHAWTQMVAFWAAQARAAGALLPDATPGPARPEPAQGPAPAAPPSGAGELEQQRQELERLARRVEELERRLRERDSGS